MPRIHLLGLLLLCVATGSVQAQSRIIKCVDAKGKTYFTQTPPPECLGRPTEILNKQGTVIRRSEGQLSEEEKAKREEERKKKAEEAAAAKEARRQAAALLNTYPSEKDIEEARARALKDNEEAIRLTEKRIAGALKRRKDLENEKEFYKNKPLPAKLQQDIKVNELEIESQQELLDAKKKQVATINAKYDEDKKRYIELTRGRTRR